MHKRLIELEKNEPYFNKNMNSEELMHIRWGNGIKIVITFSTINGVMPDPAAQPFRFIYQDRFGNGYEISYDGTTRKNCSIDENGQLIGVIECYQDIARGQLWRKDYFWETDKDFPTGKWIFGETRPTNLFLCDKGNPNLQFDDTTVKPLIYEHVIIPEIKGEKGDPGPIGPKGERGDRGLVGPKGERGLKGDKGDTGERGPQGLKGDKGEKGDQGIPGIPGPRGEKGNTGDRGPQGEQGIEGIPGPRGLKGDKGDTGAVGPKGDKGDKGDRGEKGDTGPTGPQGPRGFDIRTVYLQYDGVSFDETSGTYTVNGIPGITETEMKNIYQLTAVQINSYNLADMFVRADIPTNIAPLKNEFGVISSLISDGDYACAFMYSRMQKIYLCKTNTYRRRGKKWGWCFGETSKLTDIIGVIQLSSNSTLVDTSLMFHNSAVVNFQLNALKNNLDMATAPNVSRNSVLYIINNATNTTPIAITTHANVLARLTEEDIALASSKNITLTA